MSTQNKKRSLSYAFSPSSTGTVSIPRHSSLTPPANTNVNYSKHSSSRYSINIISAVSAGRKILQDIDKTASTFTDPIH
jgi:hypothetical protein